MSEVENKVVQVESEEKDYVEDGKNKLIVKCKFCGSKILDKKSAKYITLEVIFQTLYFHFGAFFSICGLLKINELITYFFLCFNLYL